MISGTTTGSGKSRVHSGVDVLRCNVRRESQLEDDPSEIVSRYDSIGVL
jgi:hypothetical protein